MPTGTQLIFDALSSLGVQSLEDPIPGAYVAQGLRTLNRMLDSWQTDSLIVYSQDETVITLQSNKQTYTVGVGGDINIVRPVRIPFATWQDNTATPALELPLHMLTDSEYQNIRLKGLTSTLATWGYYNPTFPLGTLFLWPTPTLTRQLHLYLWHVLSGITVPGNNITFPPGYEEMVLYNLAIRLAPYYNASPSALIVAMAEGSMDAVKSQNSEAPLIYSDLAYMGGRHRRGGYNHLTDNY